MFKYNKKNRTASSHDKLRDISVTISGSAHILVHVRCN